MAPSFSFFLQLSVALALASFVDRCAAATTSPFYMKPATPVCRTFTKEISVKADNAQFNLLPPATQADVVGIFVEYTSIDNDFMAKHSAGRKQVSGDYSIYMQYCAPAGGANKSTVLQLIHGINFDHTYWSFSTARESEKYHFIKAATDAGYATLAYDRLGVGQSERPEGINTTQAATEVAIAANVAAQLRKGTLVSKVAAFDNVVAVGHSFGSIQSIGIAATQPDLFNAVILTGFAPYSAGVPLTFAAWGITLAREVNLKWALYTKDYFATGTPSCDRFTFFKNGGYEEDAFQGAGKAKQPFTLGEILTLGEPIANPATNFKGDVLVVTGSDDYIFCAGSCTRDGQNIPAQTQSLFPAAKSFDTYIPPVTGHAPFLHNSAPQTFDKITSWLEKVGL